MGLRRRRRRELRKSVFPKPAGGSTWREGGREGEKEDYCHVRAMGADVCVGGRQAAFHEAQTADGATGG